MSADVPRPILPAPANAQASQQQMTVSHVPPIAAESVPNALPGLSTTGLVSSGAVPAEGVPLAPPGYEILGELGRGGMGIVYRARQIGLNRVVALKMILDGAHAGPAQLTRFRAEAEAVARLRHANIVQIHEVGACGGRPFFSLEYVEGGSLDRTIRGMPLLPREAAALVEKLAQAMHAVHQQGIVHRDLKPANVLLTADGTPKITDFGLAKDLGDESGRTASGVVMGTPSYMAPEQAAGKIKEIGPLSDVYALGAILYELLTGRPPFKGATVMETLLQVMRDEPVPPSRLVAKVPADLETICLKCLAKEPVGRYPSALALVQDLERFRAGEPIHGRREGLAARLWRKARRNRLVATACLTLSLALVAAAIVVPWILRSQQRAEADRRVATLSSEIEAGLGTPALTAEYLEKIEARIAELERLAPEPAGDARSRLHQKFANDVLSVFRERARPEDVPRIEAALDLLRARDPALAAAVTGEFQQRRRDWQPLFALASPFAALDEVLDVARHPIERQENGLVLGRPIDAGPSGTGTVAGRTRVPDTLRLIAEYDRSWATASELHLHLDCGQEASYSFLLRVAENLADFGGHASPATFEKVRRDGQYVSIRIDRHLASKDETLNIHWVEAADLFTGDGGLRLEVQREGARLSFQVNRQKPLEFWDTFRFKSDEAGGWSLSWPARVRLKSLHGYRKAEPATPGVLESADALYVSGQYEQALVLYQAVGQSASQRVRQEARCKEGLCLLALKRDRDAAEAFRLVSGGAGVGDSSAPDDVWPPLADYQLFLLYRSREDAESVAAADAVLDKLATRYSERPGGLTALVSCMEREKVLQKIPWSGSALVTASPDELIRGCERADKACQLPKPGSRFRGRETCTRRCATPRADLHSNPSGSGPPAYRKKDPFPRVEPD